MQVLSIKVSVISMGNENMKKAGTITKPAENITFSYEMRILASTSSGPKSIEEILSETKIPADECQAKIADLVDLGVLLIEHDSDRYGHEMLRVTRVRKSA